jgi:hypothetical protein
VTAVGGVLLLYHRPALPGYRDASTVMEHVRAFSSHSSFPVWPLNTEFGFPPALRRGRPGAIVLHYSLFGSGNYKLGARFLDYIASSGAYTVAFFQDEFYFCQKRFAFLNEHPIDCVYTHVDPEHFDDVYGKYTSVPRLEHNLPGYVSRELIESAERFALPDAQRPIDVGYRGRPLPIYMGRGSQEKVEIGRRFRELAAESGLVLDIDLSEKGRLYGSAWNEFMGRCRAVLGVESGVSLFDLEDEVRLEWERIAEERPDVTLEELERGALGRWDGRIPYRTASPRHFEAAAFRSCQVLFEGRYSGVLEPMRHYIPLRKDFSNMEEVIGLLRQDSVRRELVENARRDLVDSGEWSYAAFVAGFDGVLRDAGLTPEPAPARVEEMAGLIRRGDRARRARTAARWRTRLALSALFRAISPVTGRMRKLIGRPLPVADARR